jgi:glyoxylase-like metal-dependent hydrolase (beta-lactamase superfamily II)
MNETRSIGRFEVTAILDADMSDEPIADAFPGLAPDDLAAARTEFPGVYTDDGRWRLRVRAWLIRHDGGVLLFDTGIGGADAPAQAWAPVTGSVADEIRKLDVATSDVGTVAISHVHDDHIGGTLDDGGAPLCPNARYVIQRADVEWQRAHAQDGPGAARGWLQVAAIEDAGALDSVEGEHVLSPGLTLRPAPGHTPGHQVLIIAEGDNRMLVSADAWNHPLQIRQPDGASGSDEDPASAAATRRMLLADLEAHPGTVVAPTHFAEAFGEVRANGDAWSWSAL